MPESRTLSIYVARDWRDVYEAIRRPGDFAKWASGLGGVALVRDGDAWRSDGPNGPVRIRFTAANPFGVMDHTVETADGAKILVPMRVIANGGGAEVQITLIRQPGMNDAAFAADADWMARDLAALKALLEG